MTDTSRAFLLKFLAAHPVKGKVLDVGSRNINGTVKDILTGFGLEYTGLDMIDDGSVDIVCNAHDMKDHVKEEEYDLVICFDTLEHDDKFWLTVENMRWATKKGGWMVIIAPSLHCPIHDWPSDYYRFLPSVIRLFFEDYNDCYFEVYGFETDPDAIYGWGMK